MSVRMQPPLRFVPATPTRVNAGAAVRAMIGLATATLSLAACASHGMSSSERSSSRLPSAAQVASREQTADQQVHHVLNRLAFGARPGDAAAVRAMGVDVWIARQLEPEHISDASTDSFLGNFKTLGKSGEQLMAEYPPRGAALAKLRVSSGMVTAADSIKLAAQGRQSYAFLGEIASSRVARAVMSERQLQEVMVDFWENHFNVFAGKDRTRYFLQEYDANTIRPQAMGKFRDLLGAVAKSPAMLSYLDNWQSVADSGRGAAAYRSESTAATAHAASTWRGRELCASASTAQFIATKLARRFVSDTPAAALVKRATATFRRTNGNIRDVIRTIVTSPEFFA